MRFVSKSPRYEICFKKDLNRTFGQGDSQVIHPLWNCQFSPSAVTSADIEQARRMNFIHHGTQVEEDGVTPVDVAGRFGVFDTEAFAKEHKDDIYERTPDGFTAQHLKELDEFMVEHQDEWYRKLEVVKLPAPWPNYDEFRGNVELGPTAQRIAARVVEDGYDPATVAAYERENRNRQDVLDALDALAEPAPEESELVAA